MSLPAATLASPPATPAPVPITSVQGMLALAVVHPVLDPPTPDAPGAGAPSPPNGVPGCDLTPVPLPVRRDLTTWARRFGQAVVEIVGGDRPVSQLLRWTTPRVYVDLERRAQLVARAGRHRAGAGRQRPGARPQVASVHASFLAPGTAEVSIRVRSGARSRAVAARFEVISGRWQCSALEFA